MEEKIIDGVDVAGRKFYFEDNGVIAPNGTPERANICTSPEKSCENNDSCYCNKDCYYKQLKRAEIEIEKLYENAGFSKKQCKDYSCIVCEQYNECIKYPPFTAEKQIELIKVIAKGQIGGICIEINVKGTVTISARQDYNRYFEFQEWGSDLSEALATLINEMWQDLTEAEQNEIRNILQE